jgi:hypothetical protein
MTEEERDFGQAPVRGGLASNAARGHRRNAFADAVIHDGGTDTMGRAIHVTGISILRVAGGRLVGAPWLIVPLPLQRPFCSPHACVGPG